MQGPNLTELRAKLHVSRTDRDLSRLATHLGVGEEELLERLLLDMHRSECGSREALVRLEHQLEESRQRPRLKIVTN
jgi:hypothetical protein